jgi:hypothetical protein
MTKKFSWEVDKTSLVFRIEDGDRKTEWKIRKNVSQNKLAHTLNEMLNEVIDNPLPTHEQRVEAWESQSSTAVQANTEEASRAAQAARVAELNIGAQWWDTEDDVYLTNFPIADYDAGEI